MRVVYDEGGVFLNNLIKTSTDFNNHNVKCFDQSISIASNSFAEVKASYLACKKLRSDKRFSYLSNRAKINPIIDARFETISEMHALYEIIEKGKICTTYTTDDFGL